MRSAWAATRTNPHKDVDLTGRHQNMTWKSWPIPREIGFHPGFASIIGVGDEMRWPTSHFSEVVVNPYDKRSPLNHTPWYSTRRRSTQPSGNYMPHAGGWLFNVFSQLSLSQPHPLPSARLSGVWKIWAWCRIYWRRSE